VDYGKNIRYDIAGRIKRDRLFFLMSRVAEKGCKIRVLKNGGCPYLNLNT